MHWHHTSSVVLSETMSRSFSISMEGTMGGLDQFTKVSGVSGTEFSEEMQYLLSGHPNYQYFQFIHNVR